MDRDSLKLNNSKRYFSKIKGEDTNNDIESLNSIQVNGLKRKLNYLASFRGSNNTTKQLKQTSNLGFAVSKGISKKRPRDTNSEDENIGQGFIQANKSQRSKDKLVKQFSRVGIFSNTKA